MVVCMIGGTQRPQEGSFRGLRTSCGSVAYTAFGPLPCLKATNDKKGQTFRSDLLQCASHKAPPIKEGFWVVVDMIGGWPRP